MKKSYYLLDFSKIFLKISGILLLISILISIGAGYMWHQYNVNLGQHITNAKNATTPENAIMELDKAIEYAQEHNMTSGVTVARRADNDLALWFKDLQGQRANYEKLLSTADSERQFSEMEALKQIEIKSPAYISTYTFPLLTYIGWAYLSVIVAFVLACIADECGWCVDIPIPQKKDPRQPAT